MAEENVATLMARKEYARAMPLLRRELEKYPSNVRIRLQLADALSGAGHLEESLSRYEETAKYYEENGLIVQAIAVRKKAEKIQERISAAAPPPEPEPPKRVVPPSPLFEDMNHEERELFAQEMVLQQFGEGDIVITEGEQGSSLYVIVAGSVKVYTKGPRGEAIFLAALGEGDFFGEVSVLTGKPRTATITAATPSELLRLDKEGLDRIIAQHPRVKQILDQFYRRRAKHTVEAMIETLKKGS